MGLRLHDGDLLFDLDGQKLAAHFDKNGFLYILDRTNMEPVRVAPFVDRIDWGEVDEKGNVTPKLYPEKEGDPVHFWPGPAGAKERTYVCYSPKTELLYVLVQDVGATATRRRREFKESIPYWGAGVAVDRDDQTGYVSAYDPRTGQERWRWTTTSACARRCWPRAATSSSAGSPAGSSTPGTPTAENCCGGSSAAAAPQQPVDVQRRRTAVRRRAERLGRLGRRVPAEDARVVTEARCSRSRCRIAVNGNAADLTI